MEMASPIVTPWSPFLSWYCRTVFAHGAGCAGAHQPSYVGSALPCFCLATHCSYGSMAAGGSGRGTSGGEKVR